MHDKKNVDIFFILISNRKRMKDQRGIAKKHREEAIKSQQKDPLMVRSEGEINRELAREQK